MLEYRDEPLISAQELAALNAGAYQNPAESIDTYFPLKMWFMSWFCGVSGTTLLLQSHELATLLVKDVALVEWLDSILYFRGWFVLGSMSLALYAYLKNWHLTFVFSVLLSVDAMNWVLDLFMVYQEHLSDSTFVLAASFLIRFFALTCLVFCAKNASRVPATTDRLNLFLHLRTSVPK